MVMIQTHGKTHLTIGAEVPDFNDLRATDGQRYGLADFDDKLGLVLIFTCNHCPYAQAYEDRLIELAREFLPQGIGFVAINANHAEDYLEDSFENMVIRAASKNFPYPYLQDETQQVAQAWGAICTPHVFVSARRQLIYQGRIDDSWLEPKHVQSQELREALVALLAGQSVAMPETVPMGCSIKWRFQESGNPDRAMARNRLGRP